jgi:tetratricopeptide (TPR) repeat protein
VEKAIPNVKSSRQLDNFLSVIEEITKKKDNPLFIWEVCALSLLSYGHREKGFQMIQKIEEAGPGKETSGIVSKVRDYFGTVEEEHSFPKNFSSVEKFLSEKIVSEETERIEKEKEEADQGKVERAEDIEAVLDQLREKVEDEIGEEDLNARYNLGIAFKEMGLFEDAIREFALSKEEESLYLSSLLMLKDCYEKMERFVECLTLIDELLGDEALEERVRIEILYQKGGLLEKMGDEDGSRGVYRQVYEIDEGYKNVSEKIKD